MPTRNDWINLIGHRYGYLTVLRFAGRYSLKATSQKRTFWKCRCDCGREIVVCVGSLRSRPKTSCGCKRIETIKKVKTTHGFSNKIPEYSIWKGIKARCYNPKNQDFSNYGARGISICDTWLNDFGQFICDMGRRPSSRHTIDRIDTNGNYEPSNARWLLAEKQSENRRCVVRFQYDGRSWTLREFSETFGVKLQALRYQIVTRQLSPSDALQKLAA